MDISTWNQTYKSTLTIGGYLVTGERAFDVDISKWLTRPLSTLITWINNLNPCYLQLTLPIFLPHSVSDAVPHWFKPLVSICKFHVRLLFTPHKPWANVGPMSASARRIDVCSWRWADVDIMTVGFITVSQRWPTVGKYMEDRRLYLTVGRRGKNDCWFTWL